MISTLVDTIKPFQLSPIPIIKFGTGEFHNSVDIISRYGKNILLVLGISSFKNSPFYKPFISESTIMGLKVTEITVIGEPSPEFIDKIVKEQKEKNIDVVVAIGGGSVLDAGKAISAMLPVKDSINNYLEGIGNKIHPGSKIPFVAIPTTAGTGSETTKNAVISKIGSFKKSLRHENFIPNIAIVDPRLTLSCNKKITTACGLDSFTQLIGAYLSINSSPFTDALALEGIKAIKEGLLQSFEDPTNLEARSNLSYASMISGIVLDNAGLGLVHGFASAIGGMFKIPHGVVCGTLLGEVLEHNIIALENIPNGGGGIFLDKYSNISRIFSLGMNLSDIEILEFLVTTIKSWIDVMGIEKLSYYGIIEGDLISIVENTSLKNNPVAISKEGMINILKERL